MLELNAKTTALVVCGVVINSGLSPSSLDEPASLEWCGM